MSLKPTNLKRQLGTDTGQFRIYAVWLYLCLFHPSFIYEAKLMLKFSIDWIKDKYEDCKFSLSLFKSRLTKASGKWTISKIRLHSAACPPWIEQLGWAMQTVPPSLNNKNETLTHVKWRIYCTWICKSVVYCFFFQFDKEGKWLCKILSGLILPQCESIVINEGLFWYSNHTVWSLWPI